MNFPTLPYDNVTYSFFLEIWFLGPTHPTILYDVTLFTLFSPAYRRTLETGVSVSDVMDLTH